MTQETTGLPPVLLTALPGSRLEELLASYDSLKAQFEDAKARYEALTSALKNEMAATAPSGTTDITLAGAPGLPRLRMRWLRPWRFQPKQFLADYPQLYVQYEKQGGQWDMRAAD